MANYRTPCSGNFIASLLGLAETMRAQGNGVHFLFPELANGGGYTWSEWLQENGFSVTLLNDKLPQKEILACIQDLIKRHNIKIIHCHFGFCGKLLIAHTDKLGARIVIHDHMDFAMDRNLYVQKLRTLILSAIYRIRKIHVISVMERKRKAYSLCGTKYSHIVPNGLSLRRNTPTEVTPEERRAEWGLASDDKMCFFLGWDKFGKGLDIAVKAISICRKEDPSFHLGVIGCSSDANDWILKHTGIEPSCEWLHFLPNYEDMFVCHRAADVYLSASRREAFSYGVLETISQNTPVVISDIEGTRWATKYNKSITYPVEDANACAKAIMQAAEMGRKPSNYKEIIEEYRLDLWCERVMEIYTQML